MFDWLYDLVEAAGWSAYFIEATAVAVDGFFPVVPGETVVITAAVLAAQGELSVILVGIAAFVGAVAGDNVSYLLGDKLGRRAAKKIFNSDRAQERFEWARRQSDERPWVITVARFVPGGRTATTFAAGTLEMPWRRFIVYDLLGAALWATFSTLLGYLGGEAFKDSLWKPLLVSLGAAAVISLIAEVVRRVTDDGTARESG